jgi:hypothetical protein
VPSGWSGSSTERFSGWDIIPTQVPYLKCRGEDRSTDLTPKSHGRNPDQYKTALYCPSLD